MPTPPPLLLCNQRRAELLLAFTSRATPCTLFFKLLLFEKKICNKDHRGLHTWPASGPLGLDSDHCQWIVDWGQVGSVSFLVITDKYLMFFLSFRVCFEFESAELMKSFVNIMILDWMFDQLKTACYYWHAINQIWRVPEYDDSSKKLTNADVLMFNLILNFYWKKTRNGWFAKSSPKNYLQAIKLSQLSVSQSFVPSTLPGSGTRPKFRKHIKSLCLKCLNGEWTGMGN